MCSVECPQFGLAVFLMIKLGFWVCGFGKFPSHHMKGICCQYDLIIVAVNHDHQALGNVCTLSPLRSYFLPSFHTVLFVRKAHQATNVQSGELFSAFLRGEYLHKLLVFLLHRHLPILPIFKCIQSFIYINMGSWLFILYLGL